MIDKKLKILYINAMGPTERNPQGGIFVTHRIKALTELGVQVIPVSFGLEYSRLVNKILTLKNISLIGRYISKQSGVNYEVITAKINIIDMVLQKIIPDIFQNKIFKALERKFNQEKEIDLIHVHWFWPAALGVEKYSEKYNIPYVITCHGSEINITMENCQIRDTMIDVLEKAVKVEFISYALLNKARQLGYSGKNAVVIYNGIDTNTFTTAHTDNNKKTVGFVGNLIPVKGADRLPYIFNEIYERVKGNIEFVVVGQGDLFERLQKETCTLPVRFTGQLGSEDLAREYSFMDILVVPSRSEGYSCAIKEAQACGVTPIGNNVGGIKEAIGGFGILIDAESEQELIEQFAIEAVKCLNKKTSFDTEQMIRQARKCSWDCRQKESLDLYKTIIHS